MEIKIIKGDSEEKGFKFNLLESDNGLSEYEGDKSVLYTKGYISVIFSAINLIAKTVAQIPFNVYKNGKKIDNPDVRLAKFLKAPNKYMSWYDFVYMLQTQIDISGERYIYIAKDKLGIPLELWVVPSYAINPLFKKRGDNEDKSVIIGYEITYADGTTRRLSEDEIVYDYYPSATKINQGESPLEKIGIEFDIHIFTKEYVKNFYQNGAVPLGILFEKQGKLTKNEVNQIRDALQNKYQGVEKSWQLAVLSGDWNFIEMSTKPTKEFIDLSKWTIYDILTAFNIPPLMMNYSEGVNRTTAIVQERMFMKNCIKPRLIKLEYMFNTKLLPALGFNDYEIRFENPVPEDEELAVQKAKVLGLYGIATINEMRQLLGLPELEDEQLGNQLIEPLNLPQGRQKKEINISDELIQLEKSIKYFYENGGNDVS